jgi:GTP-binding protein
LLHLVDMQPMDGTEPVASVRAIEHELLAYDAELASKPRWLVLNKCDLLNAEAADAMARDVIEELGWDKPWFMVSAATGQGMKPLLFAIMQHLQKLRAERLAQEEVDALVAEPASDENHPSAGNTLDD